MSDATRNAWLLVACGTLLIFGSWSDHRWLHYRRPRGFQIEGTFDTDWGSRSMRRIGYFLLGMVLLVAGAGHLGGGWDLAALQWPAAFGAPPTPAAR